uniref:DUF4336 domain-containing protein n=1 Tax=Chromera velia CCMP2878 TaxID=1169474 RepID=A0A0G4HKF2_9ALVE|eukprot:Cvel_28416.t1-p1 / transcript=Cvel_28416.t1 / gene=Cvel_28416 / organism=Chromera_velia_CCMP2878 / gene_product=hypothetical protein / transcript_product=hypothetical protein / location=Cvel_scaffold3716:350-1285(-) / protein_length=312 / sequence_SO=supercontig / SO=protein_coding / is_pseudo=false
MSVSECPHTFRLVSVGPEIWICKGTFHLGENQTEGLTYKGLKGRLLENGLGGSLEAEVLNTDPLSSSEWLGEEKENVRRLLGGEDLPFPIDTTMTVVRLSGDGGDGSLLVLHSPVPIDPDLRAEIDVLGKVAFIIAPNLQHWLFVPHASRLFPDAKVFVAPSACGENLAEKMPEVPCHVLRDDGGEDIPGLPQQLLRGAPLMMNEVLFFHGPSKTLIASDGFYGGHKKEMCPTWFARLWFRVTKDHWQICKLPSYRTTRVVSHGNPKELLACVEDLVSRWEFEQIIYAHGSPPFREQPRKAFVDSWKAILDL